MRQLSATEASRNFADLRDGVENRGESFLVVRHGRAVATILPATGQSGKALKEALRDQRPDDGWVGKLRELRERFVAAVLGAVSIEPYDIGVAEAHAALLVVVYR